MRPHDLNTLEFARVRERLAAFAVSTIGREACLAVAPAANEEEARRRLERAWQAHRLLEVHGEPPLPAFPDIRGALNAARHAEFVLDGPTLVEIHAVLAAARKAGAYLRRHAVSAPALADLAATLRGHPELEGSLTRALDDEGLVRDTASDEVARARASIRDLRAGLSQRLEALVHERGMAGVIGDEYVTLRNNRFVVPVRASMLGRLAGVVQDRSLSGETLFVEPLFAVEMNNSLLMAVKEEEAAVRRVLADLTALVRCEYDALATQFEALGAADALFAHARFTRTFRCVQPTFSQGEIDLRGARHPGLLFSGRPVTPIDLRLPADHATLIITGPNTGGKTVALKTLGLCAVMARCGLPIPAAEGARLPCFDAVFADVGDEQSIEKNLSTFSAHLVNLRAIFAAAGPGALVLLDEPGAGTDPDDGAALAVGILRELTARGARVVATTHYTPVKTFSLGEPRYMVAAVDFDIERLAPAYRLTYHSLGRSLALPIARRLGLPEEVLQAAEAARSHAARKWEGALDDLESRRGELEAHLADARERSTALAAREEESRRILAELREQRREVWQLELRKAREFVREVKEEGRALQAAARRDATDRQKLYEFARRQIEAIDTRAREETTPAVTSAPPHPPRVGETVAVGERGLSGELLSIDGKRAWIRRGSLRFEVPAEELRPTGAVPDAQTHVHVVAASAEIPNEISLLGLRTREAVERLDAYLDRALLAGYPCVRVIHGIGSGALRRAVRDYLAASPYCGDYRNADDSEGGARVTVVTLT